jgi:hypothetical protein
MTIIRPNSLPTWATSNTADVVEPPLAQKEIGWLPDDQPPAGWMNWFQRYVGEWLDYLDENASGWAYTVTIDDKTASEHTLNCVTTGLYETQGETIVAIGSNVYAEHYIFYSRGPTGDSPWNTKIIVGSIVVDIVNANGYWAILSYSSDIGWHIQYNTQGPGYDFAIGAIFGVGSGFNFYSLKFLNGYWIVTGDDGTLRYRASDPTDPFTANDQGSKDLYDIDYSEEDDLFVLVGDDGTILHRASDPTGAFVDNSESIYEFRAITHGRINGVTRWVIFGSGGVIRSSITPAGTWTAGSKDGTGVSFYDAGYGNGIFFASGYLNPNLGGYWVSRDGVTFKMAHRGKGVNDCCYGTNRIITVGTDGIIVLSNRHGG